MLKKSHYNKKYKLCFVETILKGYARLVFADSNPENLTGDDWDDAPYQHNAEYPYEIARDGSKVNFKEIIICNHYLITADELGCFSVNEITKKTVPWFQIKESSFYSGSEYESTLSLLKKTDTEIFTKL